MMGREIRRVPPHWEHPERDCHHSPWRGGCDYAKSHNGQCLRPLYDRPFKEAAKEWKEEFQAWERGERPSYCAEENREMEFWEWSGNPPDPKYYRPEWKDGEATWFQVYETVSEGTPVTPPFATREELVEYLCSKGDYWDQHRGDAPPSRKAVEAFVLHDGWVPSMVITDGVITNGIEIPALHADAARS